MITLLSFVGCSLAMLISWLVAQGKLKAVYIVGIAVHGCFIGINGMIAWAGQPGVLFLIVPSIWAMAMSFVGLRRIARETGVTK